MRLGLLGTLCFFALSCASPPARVAAPPKPAPSGVRPHNQRDALVAELRKLERPGRILEGLSPAARADLDKMLAGLTEDERRELANPGGQWVRARPLLHLAAGGDAAEAYFLLATTAHASEQLIFARQTGGGKSFDDLVASTRALVERSAARWLRDRAVEAASPESATAELCDKIDRAAVPLELTRLRRRARELAAVIEPQSQRHASVAQAAAWDLDIEAARSALERARATAKGDADTDVIPFVERTIARAEKARSAKGKPLDIEAAVAGARAHLQLGREADARALLDAHAASVEKHLGLATTGVMAKTERIVCPGLPSGAPSPLLCAVAWDADPRVRQSIATIETAWKSKAGRDEEAIGAYLGLAHVVPWLYGTYLAGVGGKDEASAFDQRVVSLGRALDEAVSAAPQFGGVKLFVDSLAGLYEAGKGRKPGERIRLPEDVQKQLIERATALSQKQPAHRFTHGGILAVAAALSQERDVRPVIALLPAQISPDYALPRDVMKVWTAVAERDTAALDEASGAIAELMPKDSIGVEGARLVLLLAEARAAVLGTDRELEVLERIATQLSGDDVPPDIRLRAAIDRAGSLARRGRLSEAQSALESVISKVTVEKGSTEADIATVAFGYLLVLQARAAKAEERAGYKDKLAKLNETSGGQLPASALVWRDLWLAEIDRLIAADKCGAMKACRDRIPRQKFPTEAELSQRLGKTSAKVMQSGVLAAGSMNLTFAFSSEEGLVPVVAFEPRLLAVELPPAAVTNRK